MKTKKHGKLVYNLLDKEKCVTNIRILKQALNHGLIFKKVHKLIEFNQKAWLQLHIDINTKLRTEAE